MRYSSILKLISTILCVCVAVALLVSCSAEEGGNNTTDDVVSGTQSSEGNTDTAPDATPLNLITNGTVNYEIIYPKSYTGEETSAVATLGKEFKALTGLDIRKKIDVRTEDTVTNKIIVGQTKYEDVQRIYEELRYYDYKVEIVGSNIIVAAFTKTGYDKAIAYIKDNLFVGATGSGDGLNLTAMATGFSGSTKNYSINSWTIDGNAIGKYKIIYGNDDYYDTLVSFRDVITEKAGYQMEVLKDTESTPSPYEILVGDTNRTESKTTENPPYLAYAVTVKDSKLVIKTGGNYSAKKFLKSLYITLAGGKSEIAMESDFEVKGDYLTDKLDSSKPTDSNLRIMSCNILAEFESWTKDTSTHPYLPVDLRKEILFSAIDYYAPTLIGFQELTPAWYKAIGDYDNIDKWQLVKIKNPKKQNGELVYSTVMFRKDLYTLVESGTKNYSKQNNTSCRVYTWVVLEDKATGEKFTFVSTHWDGEASISNTLVQVKELTEFVNKQKAIGPVFTTGDFNRNENTSEYTKYLADANICDAKLSAQEKVNNIGSWHNFTKTNISQGSCDHITATKDSTVLKYQSIAANEVIFASDHCWLIADIKFN